MNKKRFFKILVLAILIAWFGFYFYQHLNEFRQLKFVAPIYFLPLGVLIISILITNGLVMKYLLEPFNIKLKFKEWLGLSVINTMGNYLTPFMGGAMARAFYLKKTHNFPYSHFLSSLAGIYVIVFLVNSFIGIITMTMLTYYLHIFNPFIFFIFLFFFIFLLGIIFVSPKVKETSSGFINKFINVINGWHIIKSNKKIIIITSSISFINILIIVLIMFLEFKVFGLNINIFSVLFLSIVSSLSLLISITPGSLGIKETMLVFTALVLNVPITNILAISFLDRFLGVAIVFVLGPIFTYLLSHKKI